MPVVPLLVPVPVPEFEVPVPVPELLPTPVPVLAELLDIPPQPISMVKRKKAESTPIVKVSLEARRPEPYSGVEMRPRM